jgi:hypothetical protein
VVSHRLGQSTAFLLQAAAESLLQLGYLPPGRVKKRKYDAGFRCRVPSLVGLKPKDARAASAWPRKL